MRAQDGLSREELAELIHRRLPESDVLRAKAIVARRRANQAKALWKTNCDDAARLMREAKIIGERDRFRGEAYRDAIARAHALHGYAGTLENQWRRAERDAGQKERAARRAEREEAACR